MKRATLITSGVVLALAAAAIGGLAYSAVNNRTVVGTAQVTVESLSVTVSASGTVDAATSRGVFPPVAGTLAAVEVADGDTVAEGAVLARLDTAPLELAVAQAKSSLTAAEASVTAALAQQEIVEDKFSVRREKAAAREAVASAKLAARVAGEVLAQAERNLAGATLVAPIAGVVSLPAATQVGLGVAPGAAIATVVDTTRLEFVAAVDESDIAAIQPGKPATITLDAFAGTPFPGSVTSVRTAPETTATGGIAFPARIAFDPGQARVFLGMSGSTDLEVESIPDALTVPVEAVVTQGDQRYVFTVDPGGIVHRVLVTVGAETDARAQLLDGVKAGDRVATTGATLLTDGQQVQVSA